MYFIEGYTKNNSSNGLKKKNPKQWDIKPIMDHYPRNGQMGDTYPCSDN